MAYARFSQGDVYVFGTRFELECAACRLLPDAMMVMLPDGGARMWFGTFHTNSRRQMRHHLYRHRKAGHKVPRYATARLAREGREIGDRY